MSLNGNPHQKDQRMSNGSTIPVKNVRSQHLALGMTVFRFGIYWTVTGLYRNPPKGMTVELTNSKGKTATTTRPLGFTWPVVDRPSGDL